MKLLLVICLLICAIQVLNITVKYGLYSLRCSNCDRYLCQFRNDVPLYTTLTDNTEITNIHLFSFYLETFIELSSIIKCISSYRVQVCFGQVCGEVIPERLLWFGPCSEAPDRSTFPDNAQLTIEGGGLPNPTCRFFLPEFVATVLC